MTVEQLINILRTFDKNSIVECSLDGETYSTFPVLGELTKEHITTKEYEGGITAVILGSRKEQCPRLC